MRRACCAWKYVAYITPFVGHFNLGTANDGEDNKDIIDGCYVFKVGIDVMEGSIWVHA
jgi:hypothetical protein